MIVLEAPSKLVEVFGGSRIGQEGPASAKCCTCESRKLPRAGSNTAPGQLQVGSRSAPGDAPGSLACASLMFIYLFI